MPPRDPLAVVQEFIDLTTEPRQPDAVEPLVAEDGVFIVNDQHQTGAGVIEQLKQPKPLVEQEIELKETVVSEGEVSLFGTVTWDQKAPFLGVGPVEDSIKAPYSGYFEVKGDQIVKAQTVFPTDPILEALGLLSEDRRVERIRNQYRAIINRVLRHNLRNELNIVRGHAERVLVSSDIDVESAANIIVKKTDSVIETTEKARTLQNRVIDRETQPDSFDLGKYIDRFLQDFDGVSKDGYQLNLPSESLEITTDQSLLHAILEELVENAIEHTDPTDNPIVSVEVKRAESEGYKTKIRIQDNGQGIPDAELIPLRQDEETALLHGSGVGLWVVKWASARLQGEVTFNADESLGTTAEVRLPDLK